MAFIGSTLPILYFIPSWEYAHIIHVEVLFGKPKKINEHNGRDVKRPNNKKYRWDTSQR